MKKLCFSFDVFLFGGIEKVAINYLKLIDYTKYEVDVFILARYEDMVKQIPQECNVYYLDLPYYAMPESRASTMVKRDGGAFLYYPIFMLKKGKELFYKIKFNQFRKKQYDVAIAFSGHLNDIYFVDTFLKANKKIVWCHGMIYQYLLLSPAFEKRYRHFNHVVTINHLDQSEIFIHKPYLSYDIHQIYNPILNESNKIEEANVEEIKKEFGKFVVMIARLAPPKDPKTVVDAFQLLHETKSDFNHKLVFVGDGPDREELLTYIKEKKVEDYVISVGTKSNVMDYYKAADLTILSSLSEGLPTVLLESMSLGTPVLATDAQWGVTDILGSNEYGCIVPVQDVTKMADKVYELLTDTKLYKKYQEAGLSRLKDFDPEQIKLEFERLLEL